MRVTLVGSGVLPIPPPGWGAVERAIAGLAGGLRGLGVDVRIVNVPGNGRSRDEYRFALRLGAALGPEKGDVVHASTPVVGNRLSFSGIPFVYTSHSRHWFGTQGLSQRWGYWLERRATARARRVIALTKEVAQRMEEACGTEVSPRVRVIPNGIEFRAFAPAWETRTGKEVLGVGAVNRRKGWHHAVAVVAGIPDARLTIVGPIQDSQYAADLRKIAGNASLTLTGEIPDAELARRYGASDVFLLPSRSELMSIAVMEAMASGLPVVGTQAIAGMVTAGTTGHIVRTDQAPEALRTGLREKVGALLLDAGERRRMGEAARRYAQSHWDWPVVARQVLSVYEELLPA